MKNIDERKTNYVAYLLYLTSSSNFKRIYLVCRLVSKFFSIVTVITNNSLALLCSFANPFYLWFDMPQRRTWQTA